VPAVEPGAGAAGSDGTYQPAGSNVAIRGHVEVGQQPGTYRLVISAEPTAGYHVYELVEQETGQSINKPTLLVLTETSGLDAGRPSADKPIVDEPSPLPDFPPSRLYEGTVNWTIDLTASVGAAPASAWHVEGVLGYQVCSNTACDMPQATQFTVDLPADVVAGGTIPVSFTAANYSEAASLAKTHPWPAAAFDPTQIAVNAAETSQYSIGQVLCFGFLGGLILNLMPCVLPVVGLKIMSFVSQAGESRTRVLALNIWFSLGLMSVFMVLAALAVFAHMGWGTLFDSGRLCDGFEPPGRMGYTHPRFCRRHDGAWPRITRGCGGRVLQRRDHHNPGDALQRSVSRNRAHLGIAPAGPLHVCRFHGGWARHGESLSRDRRFPAIDPLPSQAG
jgi:hypothetical protein